MICKKCGSQIADGAYVCPYCNESQNANNMYSGYSDYDPANEKANVGFIILAVFFPIVGIILGCIDISKGKKRSGKAYIIAAIVAWAASFVLGFLIGMLGLIPVFFGMS